MAKHSVRKWVNLGGKILGGLVMAGPTISAWNDASTNGGGGISSLTYFPSRVLYYYTGYDTNTGQVNFSNTAYGVGSIAGGLILMRVFSYVSRRF